MLQRLDLPGYFLILMMPHLLCAAFLKNDLSQPHGINGFFEDDALYSIQATALDDMIFIIVKSCHKDNGQARDLFLDGGIKLIPIHIGHHDVSENQVKLFLCHNLHRL